MRPYSTHTLPGMGFPQGLTYPKRAELTRFALGRNTRRTGDGSRVNQECPGIALLSTRSAETR